MCGLAGFYILGNIKLSKIDLVNATNTLSHRGPDDAGRNIRSRQWGRHRPSTPSAPLDTILMIK